MPIECSILDEIPTPLRCCPRCHVTPFVPFMRGQIQRRRKKWVFAGKMRPHCAMICSLCKEIVGYEDTDRNFEILP